MSKLHSRLLIAMAAVALTAVAILALLASGNTRVQFDRYLAVTSQQSLDRAAELLRTYYSSQQTWNGVDDTLHRAAAMAGCDLLILDSGGRQLAASPRGLRLLRFEGAVMELEIRRESGVEVTVDRRVLSNLPSRELPQDAVLYAAARARAAGAGADRETVFVQSINRSLLWAGGIALAAAVILSLLVARSITRPIRELKAASAAIAAGDLSRRVPESESGDEIAALGAAFNKMASNLARAEQLRRDMVHDVAHELRTPVTNIRCQLEAMQDGLIKPDALGIASALEEIQTLSQLVDDLQDLAQADAGQLRLAKTSVDPIAELRRAAQLVERQASAKQIRIRVDAAQSAATVNADVTRLRQILNNLLSNALAYTPRGGEVALAGRFTGAEFEVEVRDTGPGIAPEHLERVFDRFYRTDPSRSRETGGTGLGLAIVRRLVELHGGRVWAENTPGRGACLKLVLPVEQASSQVLHN